MTVNAFVFGSCSADAFAIANTAVTLINKCIIALQTQC